MNPLILMVYISDIKWHIPRQHVVSENMDDDLKDTNLNVSYTRSSPKGEDISSVGLGECKKKCTIAALQWLFSWSYNAMQLIR